ncbi:MAG: glutamate--tRNA ligase, partial [Nitrososphaeria archaeon]
MSLQSGEKNKLRETIKKIAAQNALKHGGRADPSSVMGKLLALKPELRGGIKDLMPLVSEICYEISSIPQERLSEIYGEKGDIKKKVEQDLPELPGAIPGKVVTRFAPNPNSALHLGSSRAAV